MNEKPPLHDFDVTDTHLLSRSCPVCGSERGNSLTTIMFAPADDDILQNRFEVVLCTNCQFCFDDIKGSQDLFDYYYSELDKYAQSQTGGSGGSDKVDLARWSRIISTLAPHLTSESKILDIGTGKGGLLLALREQGYHHLSAIEPSETCRTLLAQQNIPTYPSCASLIATGQTFDCVLCCQVLEHVYDLSAFLSNINSLLAPGSLLYADVPDASCYHKNPYASFYYFDREHINHFTPTSLERLITSKPSTLAVVQACRYDESAVSTESKKSHCLSILCQSQPSAKPVEHAGDPDVGSIITYCETSSQTDNYPSVSQISENTIFLWGMGYFLRRIMGKTIFKDLPITGIIDRNKGGRGLTYMGLPIYAPSHLQACDTRDVCVVITSVLYSEQIKHMLSDMDFQGRILDITRIHHDT